LVSLRARYVHRYGCHTGTFARATNRVTALLWFLLKDATASFIIFIPGIRVDYCTEFLHRELGNTKEYSTQNK